jgi:hypothetical protein
MQFEFEFDHEHVIRLILVSMPIAHVPKLVVPIVVVAMPRLASSDNDIVGCWTNQEKSQGVTIHGSQ